MSTNRSGYQDRRGFDALLQGILFITLPSSLIVGYFVHWQYGLALFLFACIHFITWEAVSARPANSAASFLQYRRTQDRRRPVLVCLGDSLTHGNMTASFTPEIPVALAAKLGLPTPDYGKTFNDPLWVVNAGQNGITSHTILTERLNSTLNLYPDYIMIMIGTNDVQAMYKSSFRNLIVRMNNLPETPTMAILERNIKSIVEFLQTATPKSEIAIATLPPLGENLKSRSNQLIEQANEIITSIARTKKITVLPVYEELANAIKQASSTAGGSWKWPYDLWWLASAFECPLMHVFPLGGLMTWNRLSKLFGYHVLCDGIHLNETGRDIVVQLIIDWLYERNVAKTIAVKA